MKFPKPRKMINRHNPVSIRQANVEYLKATAHCSDLQYKNWFTILTLDQVLFVDC